MRVKQRLGINSIASVTVLLVVVVVIAITAYRISKALDAANIADAIMTASYERLMLRIDNHRTLSQRSREQLIAKHGEVGRLLKIALQKFWKQEDRETIRELLEVHEAIGKFSRSIRANREKRGPAASPDPLAREYEDRLTNQLDMKVYEAILLNSRLQESGNEAVSSSLKLAGGGILTALLLAGSLTLFNSVTINRIVSTRIGRLRDGAALIGAGNLAHRIEAEGKDEFSELADSFNDMASKLLDSYLKLEKEIEEHRRDEEALRRHGVVLTGIKRVLEFSLTSHTEEQLCEACLNVVEGITESGVSFIGEIWDDGFLHDLAISNPGWDACKMYDQSGHRKPSGNFSIHGIYGRVLTDGKGLIVNTPGSHPDRIGLPEGHPPLDNFLGVPLKRRGKAAGMIAVGNRAGGYRNKDLQELEAIAPAIIQAIDRKRAEEALRESEERLRLSQQVARIGSFEWDLQKRTTVWSRELEVLYGLSPGGIGGRYEEWTALVHPDDLPETERHLRESLLTGLLEAEWRIVWPDGTIRWVAAWGQVFRDDYGKPLRMVGVNLDITERKRVEAELAKLAQQRQLALDAAHMGWWRYDPVTRMASWDDGYREIFGITSYHLSNEEILAGIIPDDLPGLLAKLEAALDPVDPQAFVVECRIRRPDGEVRWVDAYGIASFEGEGANRLATSFVGTVADITERKRAEEEVKKSLHEKEVLLKEIHHRVKNNLQVISSLVSLQANGIKDEGVKEVLRDVTYRVRSMALVHEKLYQSHDFARIDFGEYVGSLLHFLWRSHGAVASPIRLVLDLQAVELPVDTAVPCGLILNELAGNALKHAFKGRSAGEVTVSLHADKNGRIHLGVTDNGIGLPEGLDWRMATSLGLRLVQMLSGQIGATLEVSNFEGTAFELAFNLPS